MNTLFLVTLIIETIFGLGFIFAPAKMLEPYGVILNDPAAITFARLFGSAIIGFPVLLCLARKSENIDFKKATVYTLLTYYFLSGIVLAITQTAGLMNSLGWAIVGLHLIFVIWFGYYSIKAK